MGKLSACYQKQLERNPQLEGRIVVRVVVGQYGAVTSAETHSSTMRNKAVEKCLNARMQSIRFPAPTDGDFALLKIPLTFRLDD